ncbi:MAG: RHS repeat-associated core domain-containing protein [Acidobacteriia bacterium]|nr:RHS repeat-associated core domain-containing protein [Terriglobia bacterium]
MNTKNRVTSPGFTYDDAGNLTGDGALTYTWDAENRLTSANGVTYTYDGDGKRVKKSSGTLYWYGQDGKVLEETDLSGNFQHDYIYALGMLVGRQDGPPGNSTYTSYITDPLGSIRYVMSGNTHAESDYYPFGGERIVSNTLTTPNNYKFTGLERDSETGLDHTLFRQYSSNFGRWLSTDPAPCCSCSKNPQGFNRFQYVMNNPTTLTDPSGRDPIFGSWATFPPIGAPPGIDFNCFDPFYFITHANCGGAYGGAWPAPPGPPMSAGWPLGHTIWCNCTRVGGTRPVFGQCQYTCNCSNGKVGLEFASYTGIIKEACGPTVTGCPAGLEIQQEYLDLYIFGIAYGTKITACSD